MSRAAVVPIRGGPYDGAEVRPCLLFSWIGRRNGVIRGNATPAPGRALYRLTGGPNLSYKFIGHETVLCGGCNVYRTRPLRVPGAPDPCPLCGHEPKGE